MTSLEGRSSPEYQTGVLFLPVSLCAPQERLSEAWPCAVCRRWQLQAAEIGDYGRVRLTEVGTWQPGTGLSVQDHLFPHVTGGFRGRTISVLSLEAREATAPSRERTPWRCGPQEKPISIGGCYTA